jgi:hypothetical protein
MSKSNKARHGTHCKTWKDTVYASRCQAQARSKRKHRLHGALRTRAKAEAQEQINDTVLDKS